MISLDQVYLLEQKVESAVAKIQQLQAENDALRSKCTELTNALSAKSEQLSSFESDQSQIENGIKKALDRLNFIENSVLKTAVQSNQNGQVSSKSFTQASAVNTQNNQNQQATVQTNQNEPIQKTQNQNITQQTAQASQSVQISKPQQTPTISEPSFETMNSIPQTNEQSFEGEEELDMPEDDNHDGLGFDIF